MPFVVVNGHTVHVNLGGPEKTLQDLAPEMLEALREKIRMMTLEYTEPNPQEKRQ